MNKIRMQSIFLLLTFFWLCPQVSAQKPTNVYYIDARRLTVVGQPLPYLQKPFSRMDGRAYGSKGRTIDRDSRAIHDEQPYDTR